MTTDIIQHHESFDFDSFYEAVRSRYVGIDRRDFECFMAGEGERHSFIGHAGGSERIREALTDAMASDRAGIVSNASAVMMTIVRSPEAEHPLHMDEMQYVTEFLSGLPEGCEFTWGLADDPTLGNEVRVMLLVKAPGRQS